jgi:prolyl-tRNA synthetase
MKLSQSFTKTERLAPKDEVALNSVYLTRGGFIYKNLAGVYTILPLGMRVMHKLEQIVREEMNAISGQEMVMNALQDKTIWEKTGRWKSYQGVMYQFQDPGGRQTGLAPTHEEVIADIARKYVTSYKDLPKAVYQFQTKYRFEERPQAGLLRGREFRMKDLYSFHESKEDLDRYYREVAKAYRRAFDRMGLTTIYTEASGGAFTKEYSHEFQVLAETGEDTIYHCEGGEFSQNKEIFKGGKTCPKGHKIIESRVIEVGNIFRLGTRFSEPLGLNFTDRKGEQKPVVMASYGIGITRAMGAIVEVFHDDKGIIWPESVAPFAVHLVLLGEDSKTKKAADDLYKKLNAAGVDTLYDDRDVQAGGKFADADLVGIPWRVVVSEKTLVKNSVELKPRKSDKAEIVAIDSLLRRLKK